MSEWAFAALLVTAIAGVVHDLIALGRQRLRRDNLRSLVRKAGPGSYILDRGPDGTIVIESSQMLYVEDDIANNEPHTRQDDRHEL
jgi:hypothetical protein